MTVKNQGKVVVDLSTPSPFCQRTMVGEGCPFLSVSCFNDFLIGFIGDTPQFTRYLRVVGALFCELPHTATPIVGIRPLVTIYAPNGRRVEILRLLNNSFVEMDGRFAIVPFQAISHSKVNGIKIVVSC